MAARLTSAHGQRADAAASAATDADARGVIPGPPRDVN
jgi:hypothetical protein